MTKSPNIFWRNKVFSNKIRRFRQILVTFSEYVNFSLGYSISEWKCISRKWVIPRYCLQVKFYGILKRKHNIWWYLKHIFSMCYVYNRKFNQKSICLRFYDYFLGSQLRLCSWKYSIFEQKPTEIYMNKSCLQINQLIYRLYVIYKEIYK